MFGPMESSLLSAPSRRRAAHGRARTTPDADRTLLLITAVVAALIVALGSSAGLAASRAPNARHVAGFVLIHATLFGGWIVLYAVQVALISADRASIHRRLGIAGVLLAISMLVMGYATAIRAARTGYAPIPGVDPLAFLTIGLSDLVVFSVCVGAGLFWRHTPDIHKRCMWLATAILTFPSVTRLPLVRGHTPAILLLFLAILAIVPVYERVVTGRAHWVSVWGSAAMFLQLPLRRAIGTTLWWHAFAAWLIK